MQAAELRRELGVRGADRFEIDPVLAVPALEKTSKEAPRLLARGRRRIGRRLMR
jgi:hypothetical protein